MCKTHPRVVQLCSYVPDQALYPLIGGKVSDRHIDHCFGGEDVDVLKADGSLLLTYRVNALDADITRHASPALRKVVHISHERHTAAGDQEGAPSGIAGFFDPCGRFRYCRMTAFTRHRREYWAMLNDYLLANDALLRQWCPDHYEARLHLAKRAHPYWLIPSTVFSTLTVNHNYRSTVHRDDGNIGLSVLAVSRTGCYRGGLLVFPKWRVGVDMRHCDVLIADLSEYHGNTEMEGEDGFERLSTVLYLRAGIIRCGSPAQEWAKQQQHRRR